MEAEMEGPAVEELSQISKWLLMAASIVLLFMKWTTMHFPWWVVPIPAIIGIVQYKTLEYFYCNEDRAERKRMEQLNNLLNAGRRRPLNGMNGNTKKEL